ncbi:MAG: alpha-N-arabinofuranosidase [Sphingomonas sp.]|nr:MAG: alpha-N-arabinofuranosidase [Sphingomonas sp.]
MTILTRRSFVAGAATVGLAQPLLARQSRGETIVNPLVRQRADAQIALQADGFYTFTASVPEYDRVILRRAKTIAGLATAPETVLWHRPASGKMAGHIWAPEIHQIDGRWYVYVAAGNGGDVFHIRTYVLQCDGKDPVTGKWSVLGQLETPWDTFTLDSTTFVHRGTRYLCWAQQEPGIETNSNLYLAPLATPTTLGAKPTRRYCLGMLTARDDADLMDPAAWTKSPEPVFKTAPERRIYGPGHNSFTVDGRGRDVLVYHARDYDKITGDPLYDPNRHTRVQGFRYRADGTPDFGMPAANGPLSI